MAVVGRNAAMREIEGIDRALAVLGPRLEEIEAHFNAENEKFKALMAREHDALGRVLKCHLIVEGYLERFLAAHYRLNDLDKVPLSFYQKAQLLPDGGEAAAFVKPGVLRMNAIRNRFGHKIDAEITDHDLLPIREVLRVSRPGANFDSPVDAIEAFTTVACTFLVVPPPELQEVFLEAFSEVRVAAL